jgi:hypothetical protein
MLENDGFNRTLTKEPLFNPVEELFSPFKTTPHIANVFQQGIGPASITSGGLTGNLNVVHGYLKSDNFQTGVNGWKIDGVGNAEFNTATIRGSVYASSGLIGGWVIDDDGLYYNGSGTPNIRTSATVAAGSNGVIIDSDGIRGYDSVLGEVFNLHSDGSAPEFSFGTISESVFEINTNAVLRTASTVGDGSADSGGVLINNSGIFACEDNQDLGDANVRILTNGSAYFKGTINASEIHSTAIYGGTLDAPVITGGLIRTASSGQRTEINSQGITLLVGTTAATYGDSGYKYGDDTRSYGTGVLAYINSSLRAVPIYIQAEQDVADIHLPNRSDDPTGAAEVGDLCVVDGRLKICVVAGTPGGWDVVGVQTAVSSVSTSISTSASPSVSSSVSLSVSPSVSESVSPSVSPSPS